MRATDRFAAWLLDRYRVLRRIEHRELAEFRRWLEDTDNLLHLTVVVAVPLLLAVVTAISNQVQALPYLLFPPLASGTYTLFANPESEYASPRRFVGGLTAGALCGDLAFQLVAAISEPTGATFGVQPEAAAFAVFLTGLVTWALDLEEASAFSSALLVLVIDPGTGATSVLLYPGVTVAVSPRTAYVGSVLLSTTLVAVVFLLWRERFYERRAEYLYGTTDGDDHVLVPMSGPDAERTALFGARLAAAHEAGKVVLLRVLTDADVDGAVHPADIATDGGDQSATSGAGKDGASPEEGYDAAEEDAVAEAARTLESAAARIRTRTGVPCESVVVSGEPGPATVDAAERTNCDLVVVPHDPDRGVLAEPTRTVFRSSLDAVAFGSTLDVTRWRRVLVAVSRPGDSAHAMVDFATRLAGRAGTVSAFTCIDREVERRPAENRLANVVETVDEPVETRVARDDVESFVEANADSYDLVVLGSSGDRSAASRLVSPPTFRRLRAVDADVAIVDRGRPE